MTACGARFEGRRPLSLSRDWWSDGWWRCVRTLSNIDIKSSCPMTCAAGCTPAGMKVMPGGAADEPTQRAWVNQARQATVRRLRDEARALFRRGVVGRRRADDGVPRPLDDDSWHRSLRRETGQAREWIRTFGFAALVRSKPDVFLSLRLPADEAGDLLEAIEGSLRRLADTAVRRGADSDDPPPSARIAARFVSRSVPIPGWVGLLAMLEDFAETWDPEDQADPAEPRRRCSNEVYARNGWRCAAPGCTSRRNLEDHHVVYRSRGGSDDLSNRTCLCRFHHQRGEHGGLAKVRGRAPLGFVWRLGRPGPMGVWYRNDLRLRS